LKPYHSFIIKPIFSAPMAALKMGLIMKEWYGFKVLL